MPKYAMFYQRIEIGASDALHYKLSEPIEYIKNNETCFTNDVIVSATITPEGKEVIILPANVKGKIVCWAQHAIVKGELDHEKVLQQAGYESI